jgi:serralysin
MRSRSITESPDSSRAFPDTAGAGYYSFSPHRGGGNPPAGAPVEIPSTPALTSEAAESLAAQSGPTSTVSLVSGGITINLLFDAAAMAAPASFRAGIQAAASLLTAAISDPITVNIKIDYSGTGGGAAAGPDGGLYETYSTVKAQLINNATPGDATFNALPSGSSIQGQTNVAVWNAQLKLWGVLGANDTTTDDGSATFATDINPNLLVGVALHELTHAMGRVPYGPAPDILDLFRFTSPGVHLFSGADTAPAAYFSLDGGNTKLADYGKTSDPSDFLNSGVQGTNDPFNEFYNGGTIQALSAADKAQLDALGFHTMTPVAVEAFGSTSLVEVGSNYFLNSITGGSGPSLKYGGANIVVGQWGGWSPLGAEATASGYEVAWKLAGADQYTVWNTDTSGNDTTNTIGTVSGNNTALESLEASFHQDLNGDGVIGIASATGTLIEAFGSTHLTQVGNAYFAYDSSGSGPSLKYGGATIVAGQWGSWAPIGVEATASGYEVAWKLAGADQYTVWNADANGNDTTNTIGTVSGSNTAIESLEASFHQDLNGDGTIGIPAAKAGLLPTASTHDAPVAVVSNDTFVFASSFGADAAASTGRGDLIGIDGFSADAKYAELAAFFNDAHTTAQAEMLSGVDHGYNVTIDPGTHQSADPTSFQFADAHAGAFIIR